MSRKSGTNKRKLSQIINIRITDNMFRVIQEQSESRGITAISLCREILGSHLSGIEPDDVQRVRRLPDFSLPGIVHDLDHAREVAAEATGMLKLAAQRYRETGQTEIHAEAEVILSRMKSASLNLLELNSDISREWRALLKGQAVPE